MQLHREYLVLFPNRTEVNMHSANNESPYLTFSLPHFAQHVKTHPEPCPLCLGHLHHLTLIQNDLRRIHLGTSHLVSVATDFWEHGLNNHGSHQWGIHCNFTFSSTIGETEVESTDDGVGVVDGDGPDVGKGLDLLRPTTQISTLPRNTVKPFTYTTLT